jgi:replicative DNA helicase
MLSEAKLFIDDTPAPVAPPNCARVARRLAREHGLGLIVVDYLQLMQVPGTKENRATEISEISRSLKALAKELKVPGDRAVAAQPLAGAAPATSGR